MDIEKIFSLMDKAEKSSFMKIEIQAEGIRVRLERETPKCAAVKEAPAFEEAAIAAPERSDEEVVFSPISGVFYAAKEPGAEPFVTEGARVERGDTLCIIEAMKMMNEITAPYSGVIETVYPLDGQSVAAEDALFRYAGVRA